MALSPRGIRRPDRSRDVSRRDFGGASELGDVPAPDLTEEQKFEELKKQFLNERVYRFQPTVNAIEDANWGKPVFITIGDKKWTFRKLVHAEVTMITGLPYFHKLISQKPLDDKEAQEWKGTQKTMTAALCAEPNSWLQFVEKSPAWVEQVFASLMKESTIDVLALDEFFDSDYGWNYGLLWFGMMTRTPSEVGAMSERDYQAVSSWFRKNRERMNKMQGPMKR